MNSIEAPVWHMLKTRMGFTDAEMREFRENPRNAAIISRGMEMRKHEISFEVVSSHGCHSAHGVGDRIFFDVFGNLNTEKSPGRICIHAIEAGAHHLFAAGELLFHGVDPNQMRFMRFGCMDVGLKCGGWGRLVMEIKISPKKIV